MTLEMLQHITALDSGGLTHEIGDSETPKTATITGLVFDVSAVIADNFTAVVMWQAGSGVADFSYLFLTTDKEIFVEIANTTPATDERMLFKVAANSILVLPSSVMGGFASNTSRLDGAVLVLNTDYGLINEIRVQRDVADAAGDANIRLILVK